MTFTAEKVCRYLLLNWLWSIIIQVCVSHAARKLPFVVFVWWHLGSSISYSHIWIQFINAFIFLNNLLGLLNYSIRLAIYTNRTFASWKQSGCWLFILWYYLDYYSLPVWTLRITVRPIDNAHALDVSTKAFLFLMTENRATNEAVGACSTW